MPQLAYHPLKTAPLEAITISIKCQDLGKMGLEQEFWA
jgi:hypothetical protein